MRFSLVWLQMTFHENKGRKTLSRTYMYMWVCGQPSVPILWLNSAISVRHQNWCGKGNGGTYLQRHGLTFAQNISHYKRPRTQTCETFLCNAFNFENSSFHLNYKLSIKVFHKNTFFLINCQINFFKEEAVSFTNTAFQWGQCLDGVSTVSNDPFPSPQASLGVVSLPM